MKVLPSHVQVLVYNDKKSFIHSFIQDIKRSAGCGNSAEQPSTGIVKEKQKKKDRGNRQLTNKTVDQCAVNLFKIFFVGSENTTS